MKISIIGFGHVGKAMKKLFSAAIIYDKFLNIGTQADVHNSDISFVCVPTPMNLKDGSCDTSAVEEVITWLDSKCIIIRSTVPVGFTDYLKTKYQKHIVFQPEYYGETIAHPFADLKNQGWLSFGGDPDDISLAIKAYQTVLTSNVKINIYSACEVELAKYMENAFLALKVTFCNEMYDIAKALGVNYDISREVWLSDPRIGRSHTFVYDESRGYGGSCLPKDINSLKHQADSHGVDSTLISSVIEKNKKYRKE